MIARRAVPLAALLAAGAVAHAQSNEASDVSPALRAAVAAYRAGDLVGAESSLRALAPADADAAAWLGAILLERGLHRDGLRLIQQSADGGSAEGAHRLALVFAHGDGGTPRNEARAVELFELAAAKDHKRAQLNLGTLYLRGQGVPRDLIQARAWLEKAAANGDPYALYALGRAMSESSPAAGMDLVRAAALYRQAAEKGHPLAALRYGLVLNDGTAVKRDHAAAQRWLIHAHDSGVPEAALALGDMAARTPASRDKALNAKALKSAITWYEAAARAGVPSAQFKLANAYYAGAGVERDLSQAQLWYGRAAQQGQTEAQNALGIMLIAGATGAADPVEGYKWLLLAERGGHPEARAIRDKTTEQMPDRDRKRAEALAQRFVAAPEVPIDTTPPRLNPPKP
ncbi:MAG: sel1 repeat family protein [Rhodospirillales bacterium]|nr:sel1 repeat family protein [Rhodospirillales bacterium]